MKINRKKNSIRNAIWGYTSKLIGLIMPFIFRTIVIYCLGNEYLGLNSLFTSILQVLSLSELGIGAAIVYSMYEPIANNDSKTINCLLNLYRKVYRVIGIIILVIGLCITPFLTSLIEGSYPNEINIYAIYLLFLLNTVISYLLFGYRSALLYAFQRNDLDSKINAITSILLYAISSAAIIVTNNYYSYLIILILATIVNNILHLLVTKKVMPNFKCEGKVSEKNKKIIRKNVVALMCHKIGGIILNSTDNIIISMFLGLVVLAKYTNYYYVMNSVASLIIICFTGLTAGIGNSLKTESIEKNTDYFKKILFLNGYIVIVCGTLLFTLYQDFIKLWVGNDNLLPYIIMILFVVYFYVRMIRRTIIVFRDASGMWWDNKFQPIISAILNLSLNIILTKIIGLYGIITSTIISMLFIDIPWESIVFLRQKIKIKPKKYFYEIFCYFVVMVICCAICYVLNSFIVITSSLIIHLICNLIINFIVINLIVYILFCKNENYNYFRKMTISTARRFLKKKN